MVLELSRRDEIITVKIEDAEIVCRPYRAQHYSIAKLKTFKVLESLTKQRAEELEIGVETNIPNLEDNDVRTGMHFHIFNVEVAKLVILSWKGIELNGEPAELNDDNINKLFADGFIQDLFMTQFMKLQNEVEAEKK